MLSISSSTPTVAVHPVLPKRTMQKPPHRCLPDPPTSHKDHGKYHTQACLLGTSRSSAFPTVLSDFGPQPTMARFACPKIHGTLITQCKQRNPGMKDGPVLIGRLLGGVCNYRSKQSCNQCCQELPERPPQVQHSQPFCGWSTEEQRSGSFLLSF